MARVEISGVEASEWRVRFHAESTRKQRVQQMISATLPGSEVTAVDAGDLEDVEQGVTIRVRGKVPQFARVDGDALTLPLGRKEHMVRDFAPLAARRFDVRLLRPVDPRGRLDRCTSSGPAKVRSAPTSSKASGPFGSYAIDVTTDPTSLHVKTAVTSMKTRIAASEYAAFRAWCEQVDRVLGQHATVAVK